MGKDDRARDLSRMNTPRASGPGSMQQLGPYQATALPHDSPLFLPVLPVEPSPTTGIQHCIPPLFHGTSARRALASVANRNQGAAPGSPGRLPEAVSSTQYVVGAGQGPMDTVVYVREHVAPESGALTVATDDATGQPWNEAMALGGYPGVGHPGAYNDSISFNHGVRGSMGKQSQANHDGWQWRKYGEKLVKNSVNPRSYYKCSHANCGAKKIVERNHQGEILNTEYKGDHTHPAPTNLKPGRFRPKATRQQAAPVPSWPAVQTRFSQPRQMAQDMPAPIAEDDENDTYGYDAEEVNEEEGARAEDEEGHMASHEFQVHADYHANPEMMAYDGHADAVAGIRRLRTDHALSAESPSKRLDLLAAYAAQMEESQYQDHVTYSQEQQEQPTMSHDHEQVDAAPVAPDHQEPPHMPKRQRLDVGGHDQDESLSGGDMSAGDTMTLAAAPMQQQIVSGNGTSRVVEAVTADDGYKWRKYGQKSVKNSPHPRSYYKCTAVECPAKKHVERSPYDGNLLIITYEGNHTHAMPSTGGLPHRNSFGRDSAPLYDDGVPMDDAMEYSPHNKGGGYTRVSSNGRRMSASSPSARPPRSLSGSQVTIPALQQQQAVHAMALMPHQVMYGNMDHFVLVQRQPQDGAAVAWDPSTCLITPKIQGMVLPGLPGPLGPTNTLMAMPNTMAVQPVE